MTFAGRVCAVTGASSGIGAAIAAELASRGAGVLGLARRFEADVGSVELGAVREVRCDVTDEGRVQAALGALDRLDLLVLAAGHGAFGGIEQVSPQQLRAMLEVHAIGTYVCARAALSALIASRGRIVVIGSTSTRWTFPGSAGYTAAKSAQDGIARVLGEELRPRGIGVTRVVLGAVDTAIWDERPGFDRSQMLSSSEVASAVIVAAEAGVEELVMRPLAGNL